MSDLRTRLIRLAASKPELRGDLLPLLSNRVAADEEWGQMELDTFAEDILEPVAVAEGAGIPSLEVAREFLRVLKKVYPRTKVRIS